MNREIKFRAWIRFIQSMGSVSEIYLENGSVLTDGYKYAVESDAVDLMQYTGLKDKNGVEIYEGDIVAGFGPLAMVSLSDNGCFIVHNTSNLHDFYFLDDFDYEVIGNIYQNPELLK